jgi:uncharacterized protein
MNSTIDMQLEIVTDLIVEAFDPQQIILFGSYAYGIPTPDSDVDLLIIMESEERPIKRAALVSKVLRPRLFPLDILVRTPDEIQYRLTLGDFFIQEIMKRGKVLYERGISERVDS